MQFCGLPCLFFLCCTLAACSVSRDLSPDRFPCESTGDCGGDAGNIDSGLSDGGTVRLNCALNDCVCTANGGPCDFFCLPGLQCRPVICEPGSTCDFSCSAGDCDLRCEAGAVCNVICNTATCITTCAENAVCTKDCNISSCDLCCDPNASCSYSRCASTECDTNAPSCP